MTITEFLSKHGITMTCERIEKRTDNGNQWDRNARHWKCTFKRGSKSMSMEFSQGSALTAEPTAAEVLYCLACEIPESQTFEQWCGNLGYDTDSRTSLRTYRACVEQTHALYKFLGHALVAELRECEEE